MSAFEVYYDDRKLGGLSSRILADPLGMRTSITVFALQSSLMDVCWSLHRILSLAESGK